MTFPVKVARFGIAGAQGCIETFFASLPNSLFKFRGWCWRWRGYDFAVSSSIARNVYFLGLVTLGQGSSISNNCFLNGAKAGIRIGNKVMIAPNCVLVAFDHAHTDLTVPMIDQPWIDAAIDTQDDVWFGANCAITKGVRLGRGSTVGANSIVAHDVAPTLSSLVSLHG